MMAKQKIHARNKGLAFEREIAKRMRRWFPDARRGLQFQDTEYCPDVINTPFFIECKRYAKRLPGSIKTLYNKYLKQSLEYEKQTGNELPVVIIYKLDRCKPLVAIMNYYWRELIGDECRSNDIEVISLKLFAEVLDDNYPIISKAGA